MALLIQIPFEIVFFVAALWLLPIWEVVFDARYWLLLRVSVLGR